MEDSILTSIKKMLGPEEEYEHFDTDIIIHINTALAILTQLGVGPEDGFAIENKEAKWSDFISTNKLLNLVPTYVYLKVKIAFDPPSSASVLESFERQAKQYEWRITVAAEEATNDS
jgi:acetylornithine deacetylase/succinyl-diaminopimelate desuccinylase-like protein